MYSREQVCLLCPRVLKQVMWQQRVCVRVYRSGKTMPFHQWLIVGGVWGVLRCWKNFTNMGLFSILEN